MGTIYIDGVGNVDIAGDQPTPEEMSAIVKALPVPKQPTYPVPQRPQVPELGKGPEAATPYGVGAPSPPIAGEEAQPSHRMLEERSEQQYQAAVAEAQQRQGLPGVTGGMLTRESMRAAGATGGSIVGEAVGGAAGAAAGGGAAVPGAVLGAAAGAGAGSFAGSLVFDGADALTRYFMGQPEPPETVSGEFAEATRGASQDAQWALGLGSMFPMLQKVIYPVIGRVLGIGTPEAREAVEAATREGITPGAATLTAGVEKPLRGAGVTSFLNVTVGAFPFLGAPFRAAEKTVAGQTMERYNQLLDDFAPSVTLQSMGINTFNAARNTYEGVKAIAGSLTDYSKRLLNQVGAVIPTEALELKAREFLQTVQALTTETGAEAPKQVYTKEGLPLIGQYEGGKEATGAVGGMKDNPIYKVLTDMAQGLPNRITGTQYEGWMDEIRTALKDNKSALASYWGVQLKGLLEEGLANMDLKGVDPELARRVVDSQVIKNTFIAHFMQKFENVTAGEVEKVSKTVFGPGPFQAGSQYADQLAKTVLESKSIQAVSALKELVGEDTFANYRRMFFEDAGNSAIQRIDRGGGTRFQKLDVAKFMRNLGIDDPREGRPALEAMIDGTGVSMQDLDKLFHVMLANNQFTSRSVSTFISRTVGLSAAVGGPGIIHSMLAASPIERFSHGGGSIIGAAAMAAFVRYGVVRMLTDPNAVKYMTRALDPATPFPQATNALVQAVKAMSGGEEAMREKGARGLETAEQTVGGAFAGFGGPSLTEAARQFGIERRPAPWEGEQ